MPTTYTATISHHSISRAREITIRGSLAAAKRAATKEFGGGFLDHRIIIRDAKGCTVAMRVIGERRWGQ